MISALVQVGLEMLDKIMPDKKAREKAKLDLIRLEQTGDLKKLETQLSGILAEANSSDKWTSRGRPSFLYVMYILILCAIPVGVLTIFNPVAAHSFATGVQEFLQAIPKLLWEVFGIGYLGYVGGRSYDKRQQLKYKGSE